MNFLIAFIKKEIVLFLSFLLAVFSAFFVTPGKKYLEYIDFRTLALLFCLMAVMAGFNRLGVFETMAKALLKKAKSNITLGMMLVTLCFFSAMLITNDVALITFVPFTIITLNLIKKTDLLIYIVTLETIAANLGSMLTPIGNPQNLYLFSAFQMKTLDFFRTILPYAALSYFLLLCFCIFLKKDKIDGCAQQSTLRTNKKLVCLYSALFLASLFSVFRLLNCYLLLVAIVMILLLLDRITLLEIDYSLLLTFVFLFIFVGNLGEIEQVRSFFENTVKGNEVLTGIIASQILSNVPTAILLSGFTDEVPALLIGVNLGGLGTLIASMASLISFKFIQKTNGNTIKYVITFTCMNVLFLLILYIFHIAIF